MILDKFMIDKQLMTDFQKGRLVQSIYIDQDFLSAELTDCLNNFLVHSNTREREFLGEQEFLLQLYPDHDKINNSTLLNIPVRFPNGNVIMFPNDLFLMFETESLKDSDPAFINQVAIVNT